jgi:glycine/D-amino acid oxidase-like deaminating enzyme
MLYTAGSRESSVPLAMIGGGCSEHNETSPAVIALEVVGAAGRMGSLWLSQEGSIAVSRGVAPGCLSSPATPIFVTTPSKSWRQVYDETVDSRKDDLVWVGNGLLLSEFENSTVIVPHYGILSVGAKPVTSSSSPPTFCYGKHAKHAAEILEKEGIQTKVVEAWKEIQTRAAQKLLWASCMWLLCHPSIESPLTVDQVHNDRQAALEELVCELLPALELIVGAKVDLQDTLSYFEAYSRSMVGAIPSKELATDEVGERNGVWLQYRNQFPQSFHEKLLQQVAGSKVLERVLANKETIHRSARKSVHLKVIDLTVSGVRSGCNSTCQKSVVVVGAGIVGSSVALNLARRGINVTVLDREDSKGLGITTPASWAWINANNKSPQQYQWLNQLGMRSWRKDPVIRDLPNWNGALVQYKRSPPFLGGYTREGPLSIDRLQKLEPQSNFSFSDGPVYFFADEGYVNPAEAVCSMRRAAQYLGVRFMFGQNVSALIRNDNGTIVGVQLNDNIAIPADVVIIAAGCGSSAPALGGLPLTHSPGQIAFATPSQSSSTHSLKRILVDTIRESHVLQRLDGTLVAGGGFLEVGGMPSSSKVTIEASDERGHGLLLAASQLAPSPLKGAAFLHSATAVRPMPQDGFPAIGYIEPGHYIAVTHSGVTLSSVLGSLVSAEISDGLDLDILRPFRPTRLFDRQRQHHVSR